MRNDESVAVEKPVFELSADPRLLGMQRGSVGVVEPGGIYLGRNEKIGNYVVAFCQLVAEPDPAESVVLL